MLAPAQEQNFTIGWLHSASPTGGYAAAAEAFASALDEEGFRSGRNLNIDHRWAEDDFGKLRAFAADLVGRNVPVVFAGGGDIAAAAAKDATSKYLLYLR